jgi:hypothetical protein
MIPPPVFPDVVHVANGCYISATAYIARFHAAYPAEKSEPAALSLPNADGSVKPHTVAIVSWHGGWWARDEFYGVVNLHAPSSRPWSQPLVERLTERAFRHRAAGLPRREPDSQPDGVEGIAWRMDQIDAARRLLPTESRVVWLKSGLQETPFLFFRRAEDGGFAVYDPVFGTVRAVSRLNEPAALVTAVAERLGYPKPAWQETTVALDRGATLQPALAGHKGLFASARRFASRMLRPAGPGPATSGALPDRDEHAA